jgi:hypothetical protein
MREYPLPAFMRLARAVRIYSQAAERIGRPAPSVTISVACQGATATQVTKPWIGRTGSGYARRCVTETAQLGQ